MGGGRWAVGDENSHEPDLDTRGTKNRQTFFEFFVRSPFALPPTYQKLTRSSPAIWRLKMSPKMCCWISSLNRFVIFNAST